MTRLWFTFAKPLPAPGEGFGERVVGAYCPRRM